MDTNNTNNGTTVITTVNIPENNRIKENMKIASKALRINADLWNSISKEKGGFKNTMWVITIILCIIGLILLVYGIISNTNIYLIITGVVVILAAGLAKQYVWYRIFAKLSAYNIKKEIKRKGLEQKYNDFKIIGEYKDYSRILSSKYPELSL